LFANPATYSDSEEWVETTQRNGIVTYIGRKNESGYKPTRAIMSVKASPEKVIEVLTNVTDYTTWVPQCDYAKELSNRSNVSIYYYQVFSVPLIKDRDLVSLVSISKEKGHYKILISSVPNHIGHYEEKVRLQHFEAEYTITPLENGYTKLDLKCELNMDGIPAFLVNWGNESKPYVAFQQLREQINKS